MEAFFPRVITIDIFGLEVTEPLLYEKVTLNYVRHVMACHHISMHGTDACQPAQQTPRRPDTSWTYKFIDPNHNISQ